MARIVVLGAGICGLAAGMTLRRDGHDVTVLERDSESAPASVEDACEHWSRGGVAQFHLPHFLQPRGRIVLEEMLPDVLPALEAAGGLRFDALQRLLPLIPDPSPRDGDERFQTITARRPALEQVLGRAAEAELGLEIRRGVAVSELVIRPHDGVPHVTGVRTASGRELRADLVVDAMGRRSQLPRWLAQAGVAPIHEEVEDSGYIYYTRFFRGRDGQTPEFRAPPVTPIGTFSLLTIPSDNDTWSIVVVTSAGDAPLKRLRDPSLWTALVAACPRHQHWLDGDPITDVVAMGGVTDRYRRFNPDGRVLVTGFAAVGDAWACTNPTNGRGMSLGLLHVGRLGDVVRTHLEDRREFAEVWDAVTEAELTPWYRENVEEDRLRVSEIEALRNGREPEPPSTSSAIFHRALAVAAGRDPDALRVALDARGCVVPLRDALAKPDLVARILQIARECDRPPLAGPNRVQLLELLNRRSKLRDGRVHVRDRGGDIAPYARCENRESAA
jgi:2-polyprenyl-6-methoxyphenol hydroxylase-like FAD-dependent oxidoreductase